MEKIKVLEYLRQHKADEVDLEAVDGVLKAARAGNAECQHIFGLWLHNFIFNDETDLLIAGLDLKGRQDTLRDAFNFFSLASRQNYAPATLMAGFYYLKGIGTERDLELAKIFIEVAAQDLDEHDPLVISFRQHLDSAVKEAALPPRVLN